MAGLPRYTVLDLKLERLGPEASRALQSERLAAIAAYVYHNTDFWRSKFDAAGLAPGDIGGLEDLAKIPFCTKDELLRDQAEHPPFGSYLGSDRSHWVKFMTTSGTTGRPLRRVFSARDWDQVLDRFQRNSPIGPGDVVVMLGPVDGMMGPTAGAEGLARCGALVVHAGRYDSRTKVDLIRDLRPTVVNGSASYLLHLAGTAQSMGVDLAGLGIMAVTCVGEPGAGIPATRARLEESWGAFVNDGYGMTEIFPLGGACPFSATVHIPDDLVITEIVDPETAAPVAAGEPGEVVLTNIVGDTQPLLRYRTRDIARLTTDGPCVCGFTGTRFAHSIEGRVDDMIWYRGANIYPSAIEAALRGLPELGSEYRVVIDGPAASPVLTVQVETATETPADDLAERVASALAVAVGVTARVEPLAPGALPRTDDSTKTRRVVDSRS